MHRRVRVIYADLSEFIGTTAEWSLVQDGILFVQIEQHPGQWVTLQGHDWYDAYGERAEAYTVCSDLPTAEPIPIDRRLNPSARAGKLVASDVWKCAKTMMHKMPEGWREPPGVNLEDTL